VWKRLYTFAGGEVQADEEDGLESYLRDDGIDVLGCRNKPREQELLKLLMVKCLSNSGAVEVKGRHMAPIREQQTTRRSSH